MKKVKLYYRMLESNNADAETEDGTTLAIVTDGIAQRLLEGQKVGRVVCFLIALAALQGWNGGCHLLKAEDIVPLTVDELRGMIGLTVYDGLERAYRVIEDVDDVDELCTIIHFTDEYDLNTETETYELYEVNPCEDVP